MKGSGLPQTAPAMPRKAVRQSSGVQSRSDSPPSSLVPWPCIILAVAVAVVGVSVSFGIRTASSSATSRSPGASSLLDGVTNQRALREYRSVMEQLEDAEDPSARHTKLLYRAAKTLLQMDRNGRHHVDSPSRARVRKGCRLLAKGLTAPFQDSTDMYAQVSAPVAEQQCEWQLDFLSKQTSHIQHGTPNELPSPRPIARESSSNLSFTRWWEQYHLPSIPVAISNMTSRMFPHHPTRSWLAHFLAVCGEKQVLPKQWVGANGGSAHGAWAGLEDDGTSSMTLAAFVQAQGLGPNKEPRIDHEGSSWQYVHDWGLPRGCPEVL